MEPMDDEENIKVMKTSEMQKYTKLIRRAKSFFFTS